MRLQAAADAGKRYVWTVNVVSAGPGSSAAAAASALLPRLEEGVEGCLTPDPARRWTVARVLDALLTLQHDAAASGGGGVPVVAPVTGAGAATSASAATPASGVAATTAAVSVPSAAAGGQAYDVLGIVAAMEALSIPTTETIAVAGGSTGTSLEALTQAGAIANNVKTMKMKKALQPLPAGFPHARVRSYTHHRYCFLSPSRNPSRSRGSAWSKVHGLSACLG